MRIRVLGVVAALAMALIAGVFNQQRAEAQALLLFPTLDCVTHNQDQGTVTAYFGYINQETTTLSIPFGTSNIFLPAPFFRGQPTSYDPGVHRKVFSVTFPDTSYAEWTLGEASVRATNDPNLYCSLPQADVSVTQSAPSGPALAGQELTYTLTTRNAGPSGASGVTVKDSLPGGVDLVSATSSQGTCSGTDTVSCAVGALGANESADISIVVKPRSAGTLVNTASVSANELDSVTLNNAASTSVNAVSPPSATTGLVSDLGYLGTTVGGFVNPNGSATTYSFEYGTSDAYGQSTPEQDAGSGMSGDLVQETIDGLRPGTTYHYRIVATNEHGTTRGADRSFKTAALAPGRLTLTAKPATLKKGRATTLSGVLKDYTGSALSGREVVLQRKPKGAESFVRADIKATTGVNGAFTFKGIRPKKTTVYRVVFSGDEKSGVKKTYSPAKRVVVRS